MRQRFAGAEVRPHYPSKKISSDVTRCFAREVKDGVRGRFIPDLNVIEDKIFPKQILDLRGELRLAIELEALFLAENDAVGEHFPLRGQERRRAARARRELLDVVRDETVQEGRAILAGEDDRATRVEVEEERSPGHALILAPDEARESSGRRTVRQCAGVTEVS